jgi:hypothetical protein
MTNQRHNRQRIADTERQRRHRLYTRTCTRMLYAVLTVGAQV